MAHLSHNYIYDLPPSQDYQEHGVYIETTDTATVPLPTYYVGPTYHIVYTGVTSYELNGTTYYNYNLYEIPVFSSFDFDSISSYLRSNCVPSNAYYSHSFSTSVSYNSNSDNSYTVENHGSFCEVFNSSYNSFPSLDENDPTNNANILCPSTQIGNPTFITNEDNDSEIGIESHINTHAFNTQVVANNSIEYNMLEQDSTVSVTDFYEDYEQCSLISEDSEIMNRIVEVGDEDVKESKNVIQEVSKIFDWSVEIEDDDMKESEKAKYEESQTPDWSVEIEDDDVKDSKKVISGENKVSDWSVKIEDDDMKKSESDTHEVSKIWDCNVQTKGNNMTEIEKAIYEESKISDWSVDTEDNAKENEDILYKGCVSQLFFTEGRTVLDWSVEVPDDDVKTNDDDGDDEDHDFYKVNSSTKHDVGANYSPADVKYLKDKLYLEALSGKLSLKKSVPVVDILPVIKEDSEVTEEENTLGWIVDDLKGREENIPDGIEKNIDSDVTLVTYEKFIENHTKESTVDVFEEMKDNQPDQRENVLKKGPNKIQMNEAKHFSFKRDSTIETSGKESELFVESISKIVETNHVCNAASQNRPSGKEYISYLQKDNIKKMEKVSATKMETLYCNDEAFVKSTEEVVNRNEVISNKTDKTDIMTTCHVSHDTGPHGEYCSKENGEDLMENQQNASRKRSKKKFKGLRKWLSNLFCCARKET